VVAVGSYIPIPSRCDLVFHETSRCLSVSLFYFMYLSLNSLLYHS
jgi:hypothetical protein